MVNHDDSMIGHMNDTKWDELRLAMYELGEEHPKWRTKDVENGYISDWDGEWYYHFRNAGYSTIEYVEIKVTNDAMRDRIRKILAAIHLPGRENENGFVVFGYTNPGESVEYIKCL